MLSAIMVLHIFQNVFYFKKTFYYVLFSIWHFRINMLFLIQVYSCYMIFLTRRNMLGMRYAREVAYWGCGMLGMFRIWNVGDVGCWGCGMLGMWDAGNVGCSGCGMWDVGCGMFAGMWDVDLQNDFVKFILKSTSRWLFLFVRLNLLCQW